MKRLLLTLLLLVAGNTSQAQDFDHSTWNVLLQKHVVPIGAGHATQVDYGAMQADRARLKRYLRATSAVSRKQFDHWPKVEQLAFLINAYNAWTVELILTAYPDLDSIKDLGSLFQSPWSKRFIPLLGEERSLDEIEHKLIRGSGRYREPRIHFAVNCASIGCPALRPEAYNGAHLDQQLQQATENFLADRSRNRLDGDTLRVSSIFKWYEEDFEQGWRGATSLPRFLALYGNALGLSEDDVKQLLDGEIDIDFNDYDWRLNRTP